MPEERLFKTGDVVPEAGRYVCVVCGFIIEYLSGHLAYGVKFPECPVCLAGTEVGPKQPHEDVWRKLD